MYFVDLPAGTAAGSPTGKRGLFQVVYTQALYGIDDVAAPPFVLNVEHSGIEPTFPSRTVKVGVHTPMFRIAPPLAIRRTVFQR